MGQVIKDHPSGWMSFIKKVKEILVRDMSQDEIRRAVKAYIKPMTPEAFAAKIEAEDGLEDENDVSTIVD